MLTREPRPLNTREIKEGTPACWALCWGCQAPMGHALQQRVSYLSPQTAPPFSLPRAKMDTSLECHLSFSKKNKKIPSRHSRAGLSLLHPQASPLRSGCACRKLLNVVKRLGTVTESWTGTNEYRGLQRPGHQWLLGTKLGCWSRLL